MKDTQENEYLETIRHYKGTVVDFKRFWDNQAGQNTNSYNTPVHQGFDNVHPTRKSKQSPHWKHSNVTTNEKKKQH